MFWKKLKWLQNTILYAPGYGVDGVIIQIDMVGLVGFDCT